ncbi:GNAT family N-acetyltransferase [Curtobacterium sp. MCPF17_050]|uniref:GNAT family N-acetyltransferase n=1 Tax=Curtobacterium sp. MCPF17_050 TaxID=2175664 RepID=UPI000D907E82|nr:GNAT family N-acetyltransferase [Curtobacterium sp. MCPF17_050]WIB16036.1 GNAT family N-acetyltransferase [Curtobacterium sp. MCPF17_050]
MSRCIRFAQERDSHAIERIENDADQLLIDHLHPEVWSAAPTGTTRLSEPGFLLIIDVDGDVAGFVHVLETGDISHLEQLSVDPLQSRQGLGRALVEAAKDHARERGYRRISLRTYADVPWNAPFYATAGFVEEEPATPFHQSLLVVEAEHGLDRYGRRVQMSAWLSQPLP